MRNLTVIETAKELVELLTTDYAILNDLPDTSNLQIIFENNYSYVRIEGSNLYILSEKVTGESVIIEMAKALNVKIYIT